jgi:Uma2 family endonuclease
MTKTSGRPATYADLEAVPSHLVAEIIDGELMTHPRPSFRHGGSATALNIRLGAAFQFKDFGGPGGWLFIVEPELKLGSNVLVPDIAGWRRERLSGYPDTNRSTIAPDWVCEVLSASTERRDRTVKTRLYAEAGIGHLWIVDPRQQLLEVFTLLERQWLLEGSWTSGDIVSAPPFEAISLSLADLWPLDQPLGFNEDPQALYAGDR